MRIKTISPKKGFRCLVLVVVFAICAAFWFSDAFATSSAISTDSPAYAVGDTVTISGSVSLKNSPLSVEIINPQGVSRLWQTNSDANGNFQTSYPLTEKAWLNGGTFKVSALSQNNVIGSTNFIFLASNNVAIPKTMSDVTQQWLLGKITDLEYLQSVQSLINNHSLVLPIITSSTHTDPPLDSEFHSDALSWVSQKSDDVEFAKGLIYLFSEGYLPVQITISAQPSGFAMTYSQSGTSNTNVLFFIPLGTTAYDVGQVVHFRGQVLTSVNGPPTGIPNVPYEIVDADNGQIFTQGSTNSDGTFEYDWPAQSSGSFQRDLKAVFPGQGNFQMSQSNTVKLSIYTVIPPPSTSPSRAQAPTNPTSPSSSPITAVPSENVVTPQLIPQNIGTVRIISGTGDFAGLLSNNKAITVQPSSQISGTIQLSVTNNIVSNRNIPLILVYSWGPHQSSWQTIVGSLQRGTADYTANVNLQAPQTGNYFLIFAFSGDSSGDYVASSTNGAEGQPRWNNGHDLADLQSPQISQAQQFGHTLHQELTLNGYQPKDLAADAVIVNVAQAAVPFNSANTGLPQQSQINQNPNPPVSSTAQDSFSGIAGAIFFVILIALAIFFIKRRSKRLPSRSRPKITTTSPRISPSPSPQPGSVSIFTPPTTPTPTGYTNPNPVMPKTSPRTQPSTQRPTYTQPSNRITKSPSVAKILDHTDYATAMNVISKITKNQELRNATIVSRNNRLIRATGNFGGVYEISINGKFYALKYFTRPKTNMEDRYNKIERYIKSNSVKNNLDFLISFQYLPNVITMPDGLTYPLLKMDWVQGKPIGGFLEKYSKNKTLLLQFADKFLDCVIKMQACNMAHGDLSDGNVMITKEQPNVEIKFVDYDGMFIPDFAGTLAPEDGRPNFQHPLRKGGKFYNKDLDNFSTLVIYLTILAISEDPKLVKLYDEGLLVVHDFMKPSQSTIIKTLLSSRSGKVQALTRLLLESLKHDPSWDGIAATKIKGIS